MCRVRHFVGQSFDSAAQSQHWSHDVLQSTIKTFPVASFQHGPSGLCAHNARCSVCRKEQCRAVRCNKSMIPRRLPSSHCRWVEDGLPQANVFRILCKLSQMKDGPAWKLVSLHRAPDKQDLCLLSHRCPALDACSQSTATAKRCEPCFDLTLGGSSEAYLSPFSF